MENKWFQKKANIHFVDLLEFKKVQKLIKKIKPKTIFHLSTYGAYSFQNNRDNIKKINLDASLNLLDSCQSVPFKIAAPRWNNLSLKVAEDIWFGSLHQW